MANGTSLAKMLRAAIAGALALAMGAPAASAQDAQMDNFRLQPSQSTPRPTVDVAPTPIASPTSAPTPAATPTPTTAASPLPTASPRPTATPRSAPAEPARPTVAEPTPAVTAAPAATSAPAPAPVPVPQPFPTAGASPDLAPRTRTVSETGRTFWWIWVGLTLAALAAAGLYLRRRATRPSEDEALSVLDEPIAASPVASPPAALPPAAPAAPSPRPAPPAAPVATPPPAPVRASPRHEDFLDVSLSARRLSATLLNTSLNYELVVTNHGEMAVGPVTVTCDMIGAHASLPDKIQLENPGQDDPAHRIPHLGPGESATMAGELRLPLTAITPIRHGAAALFVPLARFRLVVWRQGRPPISANRTFVIGETPPTPDAGLKPFRLDLGPRMYSSISQREVSVPA